jgi:hypothetical protein
MDIKDYSFIGSGTHFLRDINGTTGFLPVGNVSDLKLTSEEEVKKLKDFMNAGGGTRNEVRRVTGCGFSMTLTDLSQENLALVLRGDKTAFAAGTVTDEPVVAKLGALVPLSRMAPSSVVVKNEAGSTTYDVGADYEVRKGGIFFPATGGDITDDQALKVSFSYGAQSIMNALTQAAGEYEMLFEGLNEARGGGKPVIVRAWRARFGVAKELSLIGDDFAALQVEGELIKDGTQPVGTSQYFQVTQID